MQTYGRYYSQTSGHRFRAKNDVQYAFAYFHYVNENNAIKSKVYDGLFSNNSYCLTSIIFSTDIYRVTTVALLLKIASKKVSSKFAEIIYNQALVTNPGIFTMEDVFFTGILRVKSNLEAPLTANGICTHFNHDDKD